MNAALRIFALTGLLLVTGSAGAVLITSNLDADDGLEFGGRDIRAQGFSTDARSYTLDSVVLRVASFPNLSAVEGVRAQLWSHDTGSGTPASVLADFIVPTLPENVFADATFIPSIPVVLTASTSYWMSLVHASTAAGALQWRGAVAAAGDTGPGAIAPGSVSSDDGGASWRTVSNQSLKLAVSGTPEVPEPLTSALLGSGFALSLVVRARRRR